MRKTSETDQAFADTQRGRIFYVCGYGPARLVECRAAHDMFRFRRLNGELLYWVPIEDVRPLSFGMLVRYVRGHRALGFGDPLAPTPIIVEDRTI